MNSGLQSDVPAREPREPVGSEHRDLMRDRRDREGEKQMEKMGKQIP